MIFAKYCLENVILLTEQYNIGSIYFCHQQANLCWDYFAITRVNTRSTMNLVIDSGSSGKASIPAVQVVISLALTIVALALLVEIILLMGALFLNYIIVFNTRHRFAFLVWVKRIIR